MALPSLTDEQRKDALAKAAAARKARSELLASVKAGKTTLTDLLKRAETDELVRKTKVLAVVRALPGVGTAKATEIMDTAEIADNRRIGGLGAKQHQALLAAAT